MRRYTLCCDLPRVGNYCRLVLPAPATDRDPVPFRQGWSGDPWTVTWHPPEVAPVGKPHGSQGICVSDAGHVLISGDGQAWGWAGGRPEGTETWLDTLIREVQEEACARVTDARLLGFTQGRCLAGQEAGLVLTRAVYVANVTLEPWEPKHETTQRCVVPWPEVLGVLTMEPGVEAIYARAFHEAGLRL